MFGLFKKKKNKFQYELNPETDKFLADACSEHNDKNIILENNWGFSNFEEWGFSQETGIFFLRFEDGTKVEADGQAYGSWSKSKKTWEWSWNNPYVKEKIKADSCLIKKFGEQEGIGYLTEGIIPCPDIIYATYLACIGEKICEAQGVYPGNAGGIIYHIGLKNLRRS